MKKDNPVKVSIIVPVYNAGDYLVSCINNVKNQLFQEYEVLIVDDGSVDDSFSRVKSLVDTDERFKVFHKENGGVSSARNYGLDRAVGEFIMFLDVDDTLEEKCLETLYSRVSDETDWISSGYRGLAGDKVLYENKVTTEITISCKDEMIANFDELYRTGKLNSPFSRLYRRSIVKNLKFDENVALGEDLLFNFKYIKRCTRGGVFIPLALYNYNERNSGSATKRYRETDLAQLLLLHKTARAMKDDFGLRNSQGDCVDEVLCLGVITSLQTLYYSNLKYHVKRSETRRFFESSVVRDSFSGDYHWGFNNKATKNICKLNNCVVMMLFFSIKKIISRFR